MMETGTEIDGINTYLRVDEKERAATTIYPCAQVEIRIELASDCGARMKHGEVDVGRR